MIRSANSFVRVRRSTTSSLTQLINRGIFFSSFFVLPSSFFFYFTLQPPRSVGQGLGDVLSFEVGICFEDFVTRASGCQKPDDGTNRAAPRSPAKPTCLLQPGRFASTGWMTDGLIHQRCQFAPRCENGLHQVVTVFHEVVILPESVFRRIHVFIGGPHSGRARERGGCLLRERHSVAFFSRPDSAVQPSIFREQRGLAIPSQFHNRLFFHPRANLGVAGLVQASLRQPGTPRPLYR